MIVLFTDFGLPYVGQMKAVLHREAPRSVVVELFTDAPAHDPKAAAYLLASYVDEFPHETVFLCVVDPGVGGERAVGVLRAGGRWYVGPDNGLFEPVARRAPDQARWWEITWRPGKLSATFHGRDLLAPVAARLARGEPPTGEQRPADAIRRPGWPDELNQVVYIDGFGNAMTGIRAAAMAAGAVLEVAGRRLERVTTYSDVPPGHAFWYENANGLVEIAVNRGRAADVLGLETGCPVTVECM